MNSDVWSFLSKDEFQALLSQYSHRAWAHVLQLCHQRGMDLNSNQVRCYRNALNLNVPAK